jgi:hypothetical protein
LATAKINLSLNGCPYLSTEFSTVTASLKKVACDFWESAEFGGFQAGSDGQIRPK